MIWFPVISFEWTFFKGVIVLACFLVMMIDCVVVYGGVNHMVSLEPRNLAVIACTLGSLDLLLLYICEGGLSPELRIALGLPGSEPNRQSVVNCSPESAQFWLCSSTIGAPSPFNFGG